MLETIPFPLLHIALKKEDRGSDEEHRIKPQSEAGRTALSRVQDHPVPLVPHGLGSASWAFVAAAYVSFLLGLY